MRTQINAYCYGFTVVTGYITLYACSDDLCMHAGPCKRAI